MDNSLQSSLLNPLTHKLTYLGLPTTQDILSPLSLMENFSGHVETVVTSPVLIYMPNLSTRPFKKEAMKQTS